MSSPTIEWAKKVKEQGQQILVVVQPISGNWVHKKFYASSINVISGAVLNVLADNKIQTAIHINNNFPVDYSRNSSVDTCLNDYLADYIFFMDTDQTFPQDVILKMMQLITDDTPVITGMYYKKRPPFEAVMGRYVEWDEDSEKHRDYLTKAGFVTDDGKQCLYWRSVHYFDREQPFWVDAFGMGCVLAKADVFRKLERPWFKYTADPRTGGDQALLKNSEDMWFCAQLKKANITVLCDPRVQCGHLCEIEADVDIMEQTRDSSFEVTRQQDPEAYKRIMSQVVDVRKEQAAFKKILEKQEEEALEVVKGGD